MVLDKIKAHGHRNILCTHETTIELTKDTYLTKKGNCILGINASKGCADLDQELKSYIWEGKKIQVILRSDEYIDSFYGFGHENLPLTHEKDIVFRKSDYLCERTVLINCSKSSKDLSLNLVDNIKTSNQEIHIIFKTSEEDEES
jgi:hypothetical protein